jgi:hypothetical protein
LLVFIVDKRARARRRARRREADNAESDTISDIDDDRSVADNEGEDDERGEEENEEGEDEEDVDEADNEQRGEGGDGEEKLEAEADDREGKRENEVTPDEEVDKRTVTSNSSSAAAKTTNRKGLFNWFFGKKNKHKTKGAEKKSLLSRFLSGSSSKPPPVAKAVVELPKSAVLASDKVGFWASKPAFFIFMVLSRISRMQLSLRSKRLNLFEGERVCAIFYKSAPQYLTTIYQLRAKLLQACSKLITPPGSLKEMAALSSADLQVLFRSHAKIAARLDDLEHFLYFQMSNVDYFLPMIGASPALSRDLHTLDSALLDAEALITNISMEREYAIARENRQRNPSSPSMDRGSAASLGTALQSQARSKASSTMSEQDRKQEAEEREEIYAGKMTYALSQSLDGCGYLVNGQQGAKDMLLSSLAMDECMLVWHLPSLASQQLICCLVWRENSQSLHAHYSSKLSFASRDADDESKQDRYVRRDKKKKQEKDGKQEEKTRATKGLVIEVAKCDLDTSHTLQHLQRYLDALHAKAVPVRTALANDALRSLSCALSITELLLLIPSSVTSLVICCCPLLRLLPWHLLLVEDPNDSEARERHLLELYQVRLGPSLSLFELNVTAAHQLRQSIGMHRMCAVDGDDRGQKSLDHEAAAHPRSKGVVGGVRGADLEVACVTTTWSADPDDFHIISDHAAAPQQLETGFFGEDRLDSYRKFKTDIAVMRGLKADEDPIEKLLRAAASKRKHGTRKGFHKKKGDEEEEEEDDEDDSSEGEEFAEELREASAEHRRHVQSLTGCRVLHFAATKLPLDGSLTTSDSKLEAAVILPRGDVPSESSVSKGVLTAEDLVRKLYVKNCALCILSRFGLTDDVLLTNSLTVDSNWEFVEAVHAAGACSVMLPLWEGGGQGLGTLAHLLFLIRFYSILPSKSRERLSIVETCRRAQLWLKDVTANDAIAFVHKAPIPARAREVIIAEMESYVQASLSPQKARKNKSSGSSAASESAVTPSLASAKGGKDMRGGKEKEDEEDEEGGGNREGGHRKFFSHFLNWGSFVVSGFGGGVHHPDLTEEAEAEGDDIGLGDGLWKDEELNNIVFEASVLRMEGKLKEALELEKHIRYLRMQRLKQRVNALKTTGYKAGRTIMDGIDYLDKTFLDQDSDEVSLDSDSDADKDAPKKPQFTPLDLDTRNQNIIYQEWKGKVGGLSMAVKQPVLPSKQQLERGKSLRGLGSGASSRNLTTPKKKTEDLDSVTPDSASAKIRKKPNNTERAGEEGDNGGEDSDDSAAGKKKKKSVWKEVFGGVRSYEEIARIIADKGSEMHKEECVVS